MTEGEVTKSQSAVDWAIKCCVMICEDFDGSWSGCVGCATGNANALLSSPVQVNSAAFHIWGSEMHRKEAPKQMPST